MDKLFFNDTETEKVASFAAFSGEKKRSKTGIISVAAVFAAIITVLILGSPMSGGLKAVLVTALALIIIVPAVVLNVRKKKDHTGTTADMGFVRIGESDRYHFDFYEDKVVVSGADEREVRFSELISVRDIGGAFQLKLKDKNYSVKKQGFSEGGAKAFKALMERNKIYIN